MAEAVARESDLYPPIRDWLAERGYTIHVEIFDADVVAVKDGKLTAIDLKLCLTNGLINQLFARSAWADEVYGVIGSKPRAIDKTIRLGGFGLLQVVGGKVRQLVKPKPQPWGWHKKRDYRMQILSQRTPAMAHELAGLPACETLRVQRLLRNQSILQEPPHA